MSVLKLTRDDFHIGKPLKTVLAVVVLATLAGGCEEVVGLETASPTPEPTKGTETPGVMPSQSPTYTPEVTMESTPTLTQTPEPTSTPRPDYGICKRRDDKPLTDTQRRDINVIHGREDGQEKVFYVMLGSGKNNEDLWKDPWAGTGQVYLGGKTQFLEAIPAPGSTIKGKFETIRVYGSLEEYFKENNVNQDASKIDTFEKLRESYEDLVNYGIITKDMMVVAIPDELSKSNEDIGSLDNQIVPSYKVLEKV